ncbi:MAG TPA: hypothetical protein VFS56_00130 [Gemmatimonadaceae bacterium]|nr:hypothetical protein [Gemmatimonadaceae bacterium]
MKKVLVVQCLVALLAQVAAAQDTTATEPDTSYVTYTDPPLTLPLGIGLRTPSYDRVNGLTIPWGPRLALGDDRFTLDALVSYRSHLGNWDPSVEASLRPGYRNEVKLFVGRGTFTNDAWIRSDLFNSAAVLFVGSDARNYYRADRVTLRVSRTFTSASFTLAPFLGGNFEKDWSTGSRNPDETPWSFYGRSHRLKMRRPNPAVFKGEIASIIGGSGVDFFRGELDAKLEAIVEHALSAPAVECLPGSGGGVCSIEEASFTQGTIHATVAFPTFGAHTFAFRTHAVIGSDPAPPQRYAYLGGAGTLATVDLLALGGDRLFFAEGEYKVPFERIVLGPAGSPFVALRYAAGSAGVGELLSLIQNLGIGVGVSFLRVDFSIDPAGNRSPVSRRSAFTFGVSLPF